MGTEIRLATPADRELLVATVVEAFRGDPAFTWFFGEEYDRDGAIFAGALFDSRVGEGGVWTTPEIDAVALWDVPGTHAVSDFSALPADTRERLDRYHDATEAMLPEGDVWYLGILASHPDRRGSGLASAVAGIGLRAAGTDGLPAVLETTNPGNVAMYERRGWLVLNSTPLDELTIWVMTHPGTSGTD
ncbi:MAG: GNAT family N-acetyltransferase [Acidimicrobiales bacterium]|jgi:GNAT superfamily N-acetyltransferase|nr:GNAT family N-acetyltransferase [Acidimicrobiales bacterium]